MSSRALAAFLVLMLHAGTPARAGVEFFSGLARFRPGASVLGFEEQAAGGTLATSVAGPFTVDFGGTGGGFPVVAYADLSPALATVAGAAGLGTTALRIDNGAGRDIRFDPPVTRVAMRFSSSGTLLTDVATFRGGSNTFNTQVGGPAGTVQFLGLKDGGGIDRIAFSGDFVDADPVLIDGLVFQRLGPFVLHYRGVVTEVFDGQDLLGSVAAGDPLSVSAIVEREVDAFNDRPTIAQYAQPGSRSFALTFGGRTYTTSRYEFLVQNDNPDLDGYELQWNGGPATVASPPLDPSVVSISPYVSLRTANTATLADTSIPAAPPAVGLFENNSVLLLGFPSGGGQALISVNGRLLDQGPVLAVINTDDGGLGSLRQAILDANASPGADTIVFDIPAGQCGADGVCRIAPATALPSITDAVTIDGTTQPRFGTAPAHVCATAEAASYMRVEIVPVAETGLEILSGPAPVVVRGVSITGSLTGIRVAGPGAHRIQCNHLGVTGPGDALLPVSPRRGVAITGNARGAVVGTDGDGVDDGGEGNVAAGALYNVYVNGIADNRIAGNRLCLAADGTTPLGGDTGVFLRRGARANLVGSDGDGTSDALEGNVLGGCATAVSIAPDGGAAPIDTIVFGNRIGLAGARNGVGLNLPAALESRVAGNVLTGNDVALLVGGPSTFAAGSGGNCIAGNGTGLSHQGGAALSFENNWWGAASGPSGVGPGSGDAVSVTGSGSVDFTPFRTRGCDTSPPPPTIPTSTTTTSTTTTTAGIPRATIATTTTTTTSSTLPPDRCGAEPVGARFGSIGCRLAALLDRVAGDARLGDYQQALQPALRDATGRVEEARAFCAAGDARRAKAQLKRAGQRLGDYTRRLRSLRARKRLRAQAELRPQLVAAGAAVLADARALRAGLRCPEDAGGP